MAKKYRFGTAIRSGFVLLFLGVSSLALAEIDPATAVGIWLFDEANGDVALDSSPAGLDGEFEGSPNRVDGVFGGALEFDGSLAYVTIPDHNNPSKALTVSVWAKSPAAGWNQPGFLVEKRDAYILHPMQGANTMAFPICNGGCWNKPMSWETGAVGPDDITEWHMYTGTYDSATGEWFIYIDGEVASELELDPVPITVEPGPVHIGYDECCGGRLGSAVIDEVAIFGVALSPDDISQMYEQGLGLAALAVQPSGKLSTTWGTLRK